AAHRLAEIGYSAADDLVGDRARDVAGDQLPRRQLAARYIGAEDGPDNGADLAEDTTVRPARSRSGHALLQNLVGGFGIDGGVVFALHRAPVDDGLAFLRRDRPNPRRGRPDHDALH